MFKYLLIWTIALSFPIAAAAEVNNSDPFCFEEAEMTYGVSAKILWAISRTESGHRPDSVGYNKNGTYDFCHMQINSSWAPVIGQDRWKSLSDPCYCTKVGAWVLAQCIKRNGYTWDAIGCYNAKSADKRIAYAKKIYQTMLIWRLL